MPQTTRANAIEGTVTQTYRSGLKVDGAWKEYAESCPRIDLRAGDKVRCSLDGQDRILSLEITERGTGVLAPETISEGQRSLVAKILDDRDLTVAELEERFLVPFKGKRLAELTKTEGGLLISFFFGRENRAGRQGGRRPRPF